MYFFNLSKFVTTTYNILNSITSVLMMISI